MDIHPFLFQHMLLWLVLGACAGFLGGLIGIGGGFVLVPGLYWYFTHGLDLPSGQAMSMALGTTMACIIFTATGSVMAHVRRGAVDFSIVRRFAPYVVPSTVLGAVLATLVKVVFVKAGFAVFCLYSATRMLFFSKTLVREGASLETSHVPLAGTFFGTMCGLLGVGGASLFVPYMLKRNVDMRKAMATASALQLPIATIGSVAYAVLGWRQESLPLGSLGFIHTPVLAILVAGSMAMAPVGVWATNALPVSTVKKVFAVFTMLVGIKMSGLVF